MAATTRERLYTLAEEQDGYFTIDQVREAGMDYHLVLQLAQRGAVVRVSRGVYRLGQFPPSARSQELEATLWPAGGRRGVHGVLSHESALRLWELSDVSPARVHITVPATYRIRRQIPRHLVVHRAHLAPGDVTRHEGVPVTTPARSILDCAGAGLAPGLLRQAVEDGKRTGRLSRREAEGVERALRSHLAEPRT